MDTVIGGGARDCTSSEATDAGIIDCDSPQGTIFVGGQLSEDPKKHTMPFYASSPWFISQGDLKPDDRLSPYNPTEKVKFTPCPGCAAKQTNALTSHLLTEPNMGTTVQGVRRLQINIRVKVDSTGKLIPEGTDLLVPMFWVEQYDSAKNHQVLSLIEFQKKMDNILNLLLALLIVGVVLSLSGFFIFARRYWIIRHDQRGLLKRQGTDESTTVPISRV
ncbi:hypothetical protein C9890_0460 [Perkinsus sp. BL_2016]|nr:hypothetical protein C9890_0460 [Perkinsus sp. BL_2016]